MAFGKKRKEKKAAKEAQAQKAAATATAEKKGQKRPPVQGKLAQDLIPLKAIHGPFIRRIDGSSILLVELDGVNDSLYTYDERLRESFDLRTALVAINHPCSIIRVPKAIDSHAQVVYLDNTIAALESELSGTEDSFDPRFRRLDLLRWYVRPAAEEESLRGDRYTHRTYVSFEFGPDAEDEASMRDVRIFTQRVADTGHRATICDHAAALEALQLYLTPNNIDPTADMPRMPLTPASEGGSRKKKAKKSKGNVTTQVQDLLVVNAVTPTLIEEPTMLQVDDQACAVLSFNLFPSDGDIGWLNALMRQPSMAISIRLDPCDVGELRRAIDRHDDSISDREAATRITASTADSLEHQRADGYGILAILRDSNDKFFDTSISAVMRCHDKEELDRELRYFATAVKGDGLGYRVIPCGQLAGWLAASPLRTEDRDGFEQTNRPMHAGLLGHTLITRKSGLEDPVGIALGHDPMGGLVQIDIANPTATRHNTNVFITGGSGSGKSTLGKHMTALEYLVYGSTVIVIDPEAEWCDLALSLGGSVESVGGRSATKISPLEPRAVTFDDGDEDSTDVASQPVLANTIDFAMSFMELAFNISADDLPYLEKVLEDAYAKYGITKDTTFEEYWDRELTYPIMEDVYDAALVLRDEEPEHRKQYDRIAMKVRTAAKGVNSDVWNSRSSFEINGDFVVINTEDMGANEAMKQANYYNILSWIWSKVRMNPSTGRHIRIVLDEIHTIVNANTKKAADMVKSMVKRIRKRGGGTTCITQEVNDLLCEETRAQGASILNNSTFKFIGNSEGENLAAISNLYNIPDEVSDMIRDAQKGDFAMYAGTSESTWLYVEVADWEFEMFGSGGGR